ncbi:MAG: hypothetical protein ABJF01_04235 [bacterium]
MRPTQFDRDFVAEQWSDAAREFAADPSLRNNENALYRAGVLFGTPRRPTYDPAKALDLLSTLLTRFPQTGHRADATARLLLLQDVLRLQREAGLHEIELQERVAALTREIRDVRARLDLSTAQIDSLRGVLARLEADRREREEQLRTLRQELHRLKEIDLRPRRPPA